MTSQQQQQQQRARGPRGFALVFVVVLVAAAAITAVAVMQPAPHQAAAAIRVADHARATAIAQTCLDRMEMLAKTHKTTNVDFDGFLDPNLSLAYDGDEHVPATGIAVTVPPGADAQRRRAYKLFQLDGGACLVRADDNADDILPNVDLPSGTSCNNGIPEGGCPGGSCACPGADGKDQQRRDRDGSIFLTSIGLYPVTANDATAYEQAHARASIKRFVQALPTPSPGIFAGSRARIKENTSVCGSGGLIANQAQYPSGGGASDVCICGTQGTTLGGSFPDDCVGDPNTTSGACGAFTPACDTAGVTSTGPQPAPPVAPEATSMQTFGYRGIDGFIGANGVKDLGLNQTCELWLRDKDGGSTVVLGAGVEGEVYVWDRTDGGNSCTTYTTNPVEEPCDWATGAPVCAAGQTACWKLIARLDNVPNVDANFLASGQVEQSAIAGGREWFAPKVAGALPINGTLPTWDGICGTGLGVSCPGCVGTPWMGIDTSPSGGLTVATGGITIANVSFCSLNTTVVTPAIWVMENGPLEPVSFKRLKEDVCATLQPARITWLVKNDIYAMEENNLACAACTATPWPPPCVAASETRNRGPLIRAGGDCYIKEQTSTIGDLICASVTVKEGNAECFVSDIVGYDNIQPVTNDPFEGVGSFSTGDPCNDPSNMPDCNNLGVCIKEAAGFVGSIYSDGDACIKERTRILGQVVAQEDVNIKEEVVIMFDGNGVLPSLTSLVSKAWVDGTW